MTKITKISTVVAVLYLVAVSSPLWAQAAGAQKPLKLTSFEAGEPKFEGAGVVVEENASDGTHSLKVEADGPEYANFVIQDKAILKKFTGYVLLKIDVFNPQDRPVVFTTRVDDAKSTSYGTRYNNDGCVVPPGKSTYEVNLTGLTRSNARNFAERQKLELDKLVLFTVFFNSPGGKKVLYLDNIRLEGSGLPVVEGLRAFDFGPSKASIYPGFEQASEQHLFKDQAEFGFVNPGRAENIYMPDDLTGDYVQGEFRMKLPNGKYEVNLCMDFFYLFHQPPHFKYRKLFINGMEVLSETMTGDQLMEQYFRNEETEDLPGQDWWDKFIEPRNKIRRFDAEVTDGVLAVKPESDIFFGNSMSFLVVYPQAKQAEGRAWMDTLQKKRHESFNAKMVVTVPKTEATAGDAARALTLADARGFIPFVRHTDVDLPINALPQSTEVGIPVRIQAAAGEREHASVGLWAAEDLKGVTVSVSDLDSGSAKIPASAVQVRKVRNFLKRHGSSMMGEIQPRVLQSFQTLDLQKGMARGIWLTVAVPDSAAPGAYKGTLKIGAGEKSADVPVELTVFPFKLDRSAADITLSVTGSTAGHWRNLLPDLEERWWKNAEVVMADIATHGMNAITGGPGATLKAIKNGKAEIDYTDMDRWLALAVKNGLTKPGDAYQGLDIRGVPGRQGPKALEENEAAAQKFGVSYPELLKIVFEDVEKHAKEKNWPKRLYSFLDEPRPEYGNVDVCAKLIELRTKASPETLFSGYYSTGGGRDVYFKTMPVSIAHLDPKALQLVKEGGKQLWDYDGGGSRHNIGRWAFLASQNGLGGYLRNGYMYVATNPYFDFSDDEGSWNVVYPSKNGVNATVGWERTAQGTNDFYYLSMLDKRIKAARSAGKLKAEADAAEAYMKQTLGTIDLFKRETARLSPAQYDEFKSTVAKHIAALGK